MKKYFLFYILFIIVASSCNNNDDDSNSTNNDSIVGKWASDKAGTVVDGEEIFTIFFDFSDEPCGLNYDMEILSDGTLIGYYCPILDEPYYTTTWSLNGTTLILGDNVCTLKEINAEYMKTYRVNFSGEIQVKVYKRIE